MARTRGASQSANLIHMDDGEFIPAPVLSAAPPPPPPASPQRFVCNPRTVERTMEASELVAILDIVLGGFAVELDRDEYNRLNPNVRRHFRPVA